MIKKFHQSKAYRVYKAKKVINNLFFKLIRVLFYGFGLVAIIVLVNSQISLWDISQNFVRMSYLLIALSLIWLEIDLFVSYGYKVRKANLDSQDKLINIFNRLDDDAIELVDNYFNLCKRYKIDIENLSVMVFALSYTTKGRYFLIRSKVIISKELERKSLEDMSQGKENQKNNFSSFEKMLESLDKVSAKSFDIGTTEIIRALYINNKFFSHLLFEVDIKQDDLEHILSWVDTVFKENSQKYFWQKKYYAEGIGRNWSSGYTPFLNIYSVDLSDYLANSKFVYLSKARINLVQRMQDILAKSGRNNILLIGDPGVGKKTLVNSFAQILIHGETYNNLKYKHVVELDVAKLLAGANERGDIEARFARIFYEVQQAGNIVLYIDNIASLLSGYSGEIGSVDASEFLLPYLQSGNVQVIGSISYKDYKTKLQANTSLESLFDRIEIKEMDKQEVLPSIINVISYIETKNNVAFTYQSLKHVIELADRYIHDEPFPQKVIEIISELGIRVEKAKKIIVDVEDVDELMQTRIKVPTGEVKDQEKDKLLNMEKILHQRIIGQDEAIVAISNALRRSRAGLSKENKPIGSFLFIGPTGVGKTETAKALAQAYYGSEKNMIRFDMSEFQDIKSLGALIGETTGRDYLPGRLTQGVKNNPYTLVLFDELEKAHPNILNLFLQILDEGKITNASGEMIDFTNTIIIATSNAGSEQIREYIKQNLSGEQLGKIITDYLLEKGVFRPEFINRFDKVICFKPLNTQEIVEITKLMINSLDKRLEDKEVDIEVTPAAIEKLSQEGFDPVFGARPLRRLIQEKIEDLLAKKMISGELQRGERVVIDEKDIV